MRGMTIPSLGEGFIIRPFPPSLADKKLWAPRSEGKCPKPASWKTAPDEDPDPIPALSPKAPRVPHAFP